MKTKQTQYTKQIMDDTGKRNSDRTGKATQERKMKQQK